MGADICIRMESPIRIHPRSPIWAIVAAFRLAYGMDMQGGREESAMETTKGRIEEFGATPWSGVVLAILLALALSGALIHPVSGTPHTPSRAAIAASR